MFDVCWIVCWLVHVGPECCLWCQTWWLLLQSCRWWKNWWWVNCYSLIMNHSLWNDICMCDFEWWFLLCRCVLLAFSLPSVSWHCWFGSRKCIHLVKSWVMRCWPGYLWLWNDMQMTCICFSKIQNGLSFRSRYHVTHIILEKGH